MSPMQQPPKIFILKQTSGQTRWLFELGSDLSRRVGPCLALTDTAETPWEDIKNEHAKLRIIKGPKHNTKTLLSRLISWIQYMLQAFWRILITPGRPLLFLVAQPPLLPICGYLMSLLRKQKYIVWIDDVYPDVVFKGGYLSARNPVILFWTALNRLMYSRAEAVFTLGPEMARTAGKYLTRDQKLHLIPTWVDTDKIKPLDKSENPLAKELGLEKKITVIYSGNIGLTHDLDIMVQAARMLVDQGNIHFLIFGSGPGLAGLQASAQGLLNLTFLGFQPARRLKYTLTLGDLAVVSLKKDCEGVSMPSKTYFMMASGCAVLGVSQLPSDIDYYLREFECGVNVAPGDAQSLARVVTEMANDPDRLTRYRANARRAAETFFSRKVNSQRLHQTLAPFLED